MDSVHFNAPAIFVLTDTPSLAETPQLPRAKKTGKHGIDY